MWVFSSFRGLWQRNPLLPLLFVIVMETLSKLLDKLVYRFFIEGFFFVAGRDNFPLMVLLGSKSLEQLANREHKLV